jgi:hypothetical protein
VAKAAGTMAYNNNKVAKDGDVVVSHINTVVEDGDTVAVLEKLSLQKNCL